MRDQLLAAARARRPAAAEPAGRPAADASAPAGGALRLAGPRVRAGVGRAARASRSSARPSAPGRATSGSSTRTAATWRRRSRSWPGWRSGSTRDRRSSTASSWRSTTRAGRIRPSSGGGSPARAGRPVAYLAFDLLHLDGRSLLTTPLHKRRQLLRRVLHPGDEVVAVPAIAAEGRALHEAAAAQGIAGVHGPPADQPLPARARRRGCGGSSRVGADAPAGRAEARGPSG